MSPGSSFFQHFLSLRQSISSKYTGRTVGGTFKITTTLEGNIASWKGKQQTTAEIKSLPNLDGFQLTVFSYLRLLWCELWYLYSDISFEMQTCVAQTTDEEHLFL